MTIRNKSHSLTQWQVHLKMPVDESVKDFIHCHYSRYTNLTLPRYLKIVTKHISDGGPVS